MYLGLIDSGAHVYEPEPTGGGIRTGASMSPSSVVPTSPAPISTTPMSPTAAPPGYVGPIVPNFIGTPIDSGGVLFTPRDYITTPIILPGQIEPYTGDQVITANGQALTSSGQKIAAPGTKPNWLLIAAIVGSMVLLGG